MRKLILLSLIVFGLAACKKDKDYPENDLRGVWVTDDITWQLTIINVKGEGSPVNYLEYTNNEGHFLKMTDSEGVYTFKILDQSPKEMLVVYTAQNDTLKFTKIREPYKKD